MSQDGDGGGRWLRVGGRGGVPLELGNFLGAARHGTLAGDGATRVYQRRRTRDAVAGLSAE